MGKDGKGFPGRGSVRKGAGPIYPHWERCMRSSRGSAGEKSHSLSWGSHFLLFPFRQLFGDTTMNSVNVSRAPP